MRQPYIIFWVLSQMSFEWRKNWASEERRLFLYSKLNSVRKGKSCNPRAGSNIWLYSYLPECDGKQSKSIQVNIQKIIYWNCGERCDDVIDHRSNIKKLKFKPDENSGLNGIRIHDLCDTGAELAT